MKTLVNTMKKIFLLILIATAFTACNSKRNQLNDALATTADTIQTVLHVEWMTCDHCEMTIEGSVKALPGIVEVKANFEDSTTSVQFDVSQVTLTTITDAIEKNGYKVVGEK